MVTSVASSAEALEIQQAVDVLLASCEQQGLALPEMQALGGKRRDAADLHPALARLLMALGAAWRKGGSTEPGRWLGPAISAAMPALWQGLAPAQRAALPQYPRLLQLMSDLGLHALLADPAQPLEALLGEPSALPLVRGLLRQARQQRLVGLAARLLQAWSPQWRPGLPWSNDLVMLLGVVARDADQLALLCGLYRWSQPMHAALDRRDLPAELRTLLLRRLPTVASRTLDMAAMQRLCRMGPAAMDSLDDALAWLPMLGVLQHFDPLAPLEPVLEQLAARHPLDARVQLLRARMLADSGSATPERLIALMAPLPPGEPGHAKAALWLARSLFYLEAPDDSLAWYLRASETEPLPAAEQPRVAQLRARLAPADALPAAPDTRRLQAEAHGVLGPALAPLEALVNLDPTPEASPPAAELQQRMAASLQVLTAALPGMDGLNAQLALDFGRALCAMADATFQRSAQWLSAPPSSTATAHGALDPQRCQALIDGVDRHVLQVGHHVLERDADWLPGVNHLRVVLDLVDLMVERLLRMGEHPAALAMLAGVQARLGVAGEVSGPADTVLWGQVQRCELHRGDLAAAALAGERAGQREGSEVLALRPWSEWAAALGGGMASATSLARSPATALPTSPPTELQWLADDPPLRGPVDCVQADGVLSSIEQEYPPVRVEMVAARHLRLRGAWGLIGDPAEAAGLLLPEPWRRAAGPHFRHYAGVVQRGERAVCLAPAASPEPVHEALVVLGDLDAMLHRDDAAWLLLMLPRIDALLRRGLLAQRKLLIPEGLPAARTRSLALVGLRPEQMHICGQGQHLLLADALVVQPGEGLSATLISGLAQTLQAAARGLVDLPAPDHALDGGLLYIARRHAAERPLLEEDRIMATAQAMGFQIVQPESLSLPEQVRLLGAARGVAGQPGAGFAGLMFAGAGTRVLSICKEETVQPGFVDLTMARGQQHRRVLGRTAAEFRASSLLSGPYRVDHDLVQRHLAWVAEAAV